MIVNATIMLKRCSYIKCLFEYRESLSGGMVDVSTFVVVKFLLNTKHYTK